MPVAEFPMVAWSLNQIYNAVYNCKAVAPLYEVDGFYNDEFLLDKRNWLEYIEQLSWTTVYDRVRVNNYDFYLTKSWSNFNVHTSSSDIITYWFDNNLPKKLQVWSGVTGPRLDTWIVTAQNAFVWWADFVDIPWYSWGYVTVTVDSLSWVAVWNYAVFTSGILKWAVNKIYKIDWGNTIYIIGTNARWSLPQPWDTISFYANTWQVLVTCDSAGVKANIMNGNTLVESFSLINIPWVIDIAKYDGNFFVLTRQFMYFTRSTFDDNLQFYPLDFYKIDEWKKMFPCGKAMIVFANTNKLFAAANGTSGAIGYVWYDINYNAELFSQHSCIFVDQAIYVMQKDRKLMQIDIVQSNSTSYDLVAKDMNQNTRGIFERVLDWEIEFKSYDKFMYVIHRKANNTTFIYEYDKQLQHWMIQTYPFHLYGYDREAYGVGGIFSRTWWSDVGNIIEQRVNFSLVGWMEILMPTIIRTLIGKHSQPNDLHLSAWFDLGGVYETLNFNITNLAPDNALHPPMDVWVWIDEPEPNVYNGYMLSNQINLFRSGRFVNFTYYSNNRFILGKTLIIYDKMQTFINELN